MYLQYITNASGLGRYLGEAHNLVFKWVRTPHFATKFKIMNDRNQRKFGNEIFGYTDVLKVGDKVQVKRTEHVSTISKVEKQPHCYTYELKEPQWEYNWHFRIYLIKL